MSRKQKGFASAILAILLTMVLMYAVVLSLDFSFQNGLTINKKVGFQQDLYAMNNALDAAKLYMETALKFSTYQAFYDYGQEQKQDSTESKLVEAIQEKIKTNINRYASSPYTFLSQNYKVSIPEYDSVEIGIDYPSIKITAIPKGNAVINRADPTEKVTLEKNMRIERHFVYPILNYVNFVSPTKIMEESIKSMSKTWKLSGEKAFEGCENRDTKPSPLEVFNFAHETNFQSIESAGDQVKTSIESGIVDMIKNIPDTSIKISANFTDQALQIELINCQNTQVDDRCSGPEKSFSAKRTCEFQYIYSGTIRFVVDDSSIEYPVKLQEDGQEKIQFKQPQFSTTNAFLVNYKKS